MENYKGFFFNKEKEKKYYEGGAHFKYTDLVNALNDLLKETNNNLIINTLINNSTQKDNLIISHKYIKSEGNKYKNKSFKEKKINSNLLTLNNYKDDFKDIIINKTKPPLSKEKNINRQKIKKMKLFESLNDNYKISSKYNNYNDYNSINLLDKSNKSKSIFRKKKNIINKTNNNLKLIINKNSFGKNLPLIESVYFNKLLNKNIVDSDINYKNLEKSKKNILNKNKIFSPMNNNNTNSYRKSFFSFKSYDNNKNHKNYDTINIISRRRNYNFGKLFKDLNMIKNKKIN